MSFQDELNENTRTAQEVEKAQKQEAYEQGKADARQEYLYIKEQIRDMAQRGIYDSLPDGERQIVLYHKDSIIRYDFVFKEEVVFHGKILKRLRGATHKAYLWEKDPDHFKGYMDELTKLSQPDDIAVRARAVYVDHGRPVFFELDEELELPIIYKDGLSAWIECIVKY